MSALRFVVWALASIPLGAAVVTCVRHADIRDEPDSSFVGHVPQLEAGDIPNLDSGLGTDAYLACGARPSGKCLGTVDFPCAFDAWAKTTAANCQKATGCKTNGWLKVEMAADGCVVNIGLTEPNDDIIACLLAEFGAGRCACKDAAELVYLFGIGNTGVCP